MDCQDVDELAGAYALAALPEDVLVAARDHLASCSQHPDIATLQVVAESLSRAAPEREPAPALKARIMEAIRQDPAAAARAQAAPREPPLLSWLGRWFRPRLAPYALAAALAIAIFGLLGWNIYLQVSPGGGQQTLVRTLADGGAASGRLIYLPDEKMALVTVEGLAPLSADKTYQVWAISGDKPASIGLFNASPSGQAAAVMEIDLSGAQVVAITIEPAGGSPQPTMQPILKARI